MFRWAVIGMAFFASIINYLDRTALSYAIGPIEQTFQLDNTDFGLIASAFGFGYIFMTVIGGVLVDHFKPRKVWSIFAIFWSISCILIGLATGFIWLFIFRLLLGVAEGPAFPAFTRVASDWLPMQERARALAFGLAAVPFASVLGAPIISHLITSFGWRVMFVILGGLGVIWAALWYILFRDHPKDSKYVTQAELQHITMRQAGIMQVKKTDWKFMLTSPSLIANNYAFFSFGYLLFFAITWLPGYLEQTYHMQLNTIGWFLIAPWLFATFMILLGGIISDWLWLKTNSIRIARSHLIWVCQILSALCLIPVVLIHSLWVAGIGITLAIGFGMMPNAAFFALNSDLAHDRAATSMGIMDCAFAASGIAAPLLTGWLTTLTGNFSIAISLMVALSLSSAIGIVIFQHPDKIRN